VTPSRTWSRVASTLWFWTYSQPSHLWKRVASGWSDRVQNVQHYAIALPKGAQSLKAEMDRALAEMYNEGVVGQLAKLYLDLDLGQLLPTPTPAATSTPGPHASLC